MIFNDKMSYLKHLKAVQIISRNIRTVRKNSIKWYCESKSVKTIDNVKLNKSEKPKKPSDSILFECDEDTCMVTEREREATVASRLSKECDRLTSNHRIVLNLADGFKLAVDNDQNITPPKEQPLDKTISKLKDTGAEPPFSEPPSEDRPIKRVALHRQNAGPVVIGFIPKEWVTSFYPKTGVTGFYTLVFTLSTYLVSKEIYVLEHNFYTGLSVFLTLWTGIHYLGPSTAKWLDKQIEEYENSWKKSKEDNIQYLKEGIAHEKVLQFQADGNLMLIDAKRENVALQYEAEFRNRQMHVYAEVTRILDYQVAVGQVLKKIQQRNLVQYVEAEVRKAVTPDMQSSLIDSSIEMLVSELHRSTDGIKRDPDDKDKK